MTDETWLRDRAAIVGFGHTAYGKRGELAGRGTTSLTAEAILDACRDAGVSPSEVDGFTSYANDTAEVAGLSAAFNGERLRYTGMAWGAGGSSMLGAYLQAAMAVATGQANLVAVVHAIVQPPTARFGGGGAVGPPPRYPAPRTPAQSFSLQARRHMHLYGTTIDHFAAVSVSTRDYAVNNPDARFRDPITVEDHHASRLIADPLRLLDCCMESDGACCVLVAAADRAADFRPEPVLISAATMGSAGRWGNGAFGGYNMAEPEYASAGQRAIADDLYRRGGFGPADVDVAMIYDHFTPMVIMALEDFGFAPRGEGGPFVADGNLRPDGAIPTNTHGGNLSEVYLHGMTHIFEAVRQCRGTSSNQVDGAETALVAGGAGSAPVSAMLLRRAS